MGSFGVEPSTLVAPSSDRLARALSITASVFDALETGIVVATEKGRILHANEALCALVGLARDRILAMSSFELVEHVASLVDRPPLLLSERKMLPAESRLVCEEVTFVRPARAVVRWVAQRVEAGGKVAHLVTCTDVTAEVELCAVQERSASIDRLTGLMNRRAMETVLRREHARTTRLGGAMTLLLLDVDHFKRVNDRFGHAAGDEVLRRVGGVLRALRGADYPARWGGEEFLVLLPATPMEGGRSCAERVRAAIEALQLATGPLTVSGGLAELVLGENVERLIARADERLYAAKAAGRNQIQ